MASLVAISRKGLRRLLLDRGVLLRVGQLSCSNLLALVVGSALGLPPLLQTAFEKSVFQISPSQFRSDSEKEPCVDIPGNNVLVLPADLVAQTADGAVLATGLQSQDTESLGNDHLLLLIVGGRDTLKDLEALQSGGTAGGLVRNHTTDGLVEDSGGSAEVEGT